MKKIATLSLFALIIISTVFAAAPTSLIIVPYDGISGIPVGSNYYHSDTSGTWERNTPQGKGESNVNYTDTEMLGIIMFLNSGTSVTMKGKITVTVTCANGFYLESQSNPIYKRPFEITLFDSWNETGSKGHKISESEPTFTVDINKTETSSDNAQIHFDVCIRLPGTVDYDSNECTKDGIIYPLSVLSDYSAIVTFNVKYEPESSNYGTALEKTVTLPFGGFYESLASTSSKKGTVSMSVVLNSDAANIDIKSKLGQTISLGSMYYTMMLGSGITSTTQNNAIFLSSSANPEDKSAEKFMLVKDDLSASDAKTALNSVGFKIKVTSYEDTSSSITFDGTTYFDTSLAPSSISAGTSGSAGDRVKATQTLTSTEYIIPNLYKEYMKAGNRSYFSYSGSMELELDDNVVTMMEGRYTETVYVHVMSYK